MPWSNQGGGGGGGPWGSGGKGPWGSGQQPSGSTPPDLEEILRRGQDKLRRVLPGGNLGGKGFALLALAAIAFVGLLRLLPGRTGRTRRGAAFRQGCARGATGIELPPAISDRDRAHAEGAAHQQDRHRYALGRRRPPFRHARSARGKPDADRRREHRGRRFRGAVEGQAGRRRRLPVQHPEPGRYGQGGGGKRHARGDRPRGHSADPDRRAAGHRDRRAGLDARKRSITTAPASTSHRYSCRKSTRPSR